MSVAIALVAALSSWAGTGAVRRYALARDLLDHPNARGSHRVPTPRGGGLAPVLVLVVGNLLGALFDLVPDADPQDPRQGLGQHDTVGGHRNDPTMSVEEPT